MLKIYFFPDLTFSSVLHVRIINIYTIFLIAISLSCSEELDLVLVELPSETRT